MGKQNGTGNLSRMPHMNIKGELGTVKISTLPESSSTTDTNTNSDKGGLTSKHKDKEEKQDRKIRSELDPVVYRETQDAINDIIRNSDFGSYRSIRSAIDIIENHFKSQVETGTSSGALGDSTRRRNEELWFGTPLTSPAESYAKYGMLVSKNIKTAFESAPSYGGWRDNVLITFKPSSVYGRATMTTEDSLDHKSSGFIPSLITKNGISSLSGLSDGGWSATTRSDHAMQIIKAHGSGSNDGSKIFGKMGGDSYFEVQYHGQYTAKDIATVTIREHQSIPKATIAKLEKYGGKAYKYINGKRVLYHGD